MRKVSFTLTWNKISFLKQFCFLRNELPLLYFLFEKIYDFKIMENQKIEIIPYLSFKGNCEKAIEKYIRAFGGEILFLSRWSKINSEARPAQIGKVMHAEFLLGGTRVAAGDSFDCAEENASVKLMIRLDSQEEASRVISILSEGGEILSPLKPHPAPDDGGCGSIIKDNFGFTWIITCPNPAKQK